MGLAWTGRVGSREEGKKEAYNNPSHSKPHRLPRSKPITAQECNDGPRKATQVVYRHDDAQDPRAGMVDHVEEVGVSYYTGEDALVVACDC